MRRGREQGVLIWLHSWTCCYSLRHEALMHRLVVVSYLNVPWVADVEILSVILLRTLREVSQNARAVRRVQVSRAIW